MKPSGRHIFASLKRAYAAQAQASQAAERVSLARQDPKVSRLANGTVVASVENYSPVSRLAVVYNAGPRYEPAQQLGITHCIRILSNLSTEKSTGFGITRNIEQAGGSIGCTTTREHMIYSMACVREHLDSCVQYLGDMATCPAFLPWEVSDNAPRLALDLAMLMQNPQAKLIEALHSAAFRNTLGQSLYMPEYKLGHFTPDMLRAYVAQHYTCSNMAVVGVGMDHDQVTAYANKLNTNTSGAPAAEPAKYHGGEVRIPADTGSLAYAAVVTEGAGLGNKDLMALFVLQKVMGSGPSIKYSSNLATSKVSKAVAQGTNSPFAASCLNASYSDSGLFGFQVVAQAADMGKVIPSIMKMFADATKGGITEQDVQRAKAQLKASAAMEMESGATLLEDAAIQVVLSGQVLTLDQVSAAVDKLTLADVQNVAKKVINGKPSMAAIGDLSNTPHIDQLV